MPRNVEIKARVTGDVNDLIVKAVELSQSDCEIMKQEDTFFNVTNGRLKLRQFQWQKALLIQYNRNDQTGPKLSKFTVTEIPDPETLKMMLGASVGVKGVVRKLRRRYVVGQTFIHVDHVEGLGDFMELEVLLRDDQTVEEGEKIAEQLMKELNINKENLLTSAYMDMILNKS